MSSAHFLRHLAIAYNHFHPIDEHKKFAVQLDLFEKSQLRQALSSQLDLMEKRCRIYLESGNAEKDDLEPLLEKIKSIKGRLDIFPHESAPAV